MPQLQDDARPSVSAEVYDVLHALTRIPIPVGQLQLVSLLPDDPPGISTQELADALGTDRKGISGILGAMGNRVAQTERQVLKGDYDAYLVWAKDGDQHRYHRREWFREALGHLPELQERLNMPLAAIRAAGPLQVAMPDVVLDKHRSGDETVHKLTQSLLAGGLSFSSETVANFLLALQTKRFVLLSGISGTGKTQLAMKVAAACDPREDAVQPVARIATRPAATPSQVLKRTKAAKTLHAHRRILIPATVQDSLSIFDNNADPKQIPFMDPSGRRHTLSVISAGYGGCAVYLPSDLAGLMKQTFPAGVWMHIGVFTNEAGSAIGMRVLPPASEDTADSPADLPQEPDSRAIVVAVRPDWTDNRGLLGYYNPILRDFASTPFLDVVLRASTAYSLHREKAPPFFVILDEMNLARVEHYFSDFLSAAESGEPIPLHVDAAVEAGDRPGDDPRPIPREIRVPPNLYFIGTVNVDETTYLFSPKVLDRAFTIELNAVDLQGFAAADAKPTPLDLATWDQALTPESTRKPDRSDWQTFTELLNGELADQLIALHDLLAEDNRHFGYRVANEIARYVCLAHDQCSDGPAAARVALDLAILQKVLVKLHGTQQELEPLLDRRLHFAATATASDHSSAKKWIAENPEFDAFEIALPRCGWKLARMRRQLRQRGFTSWIE